MNHRRSFLKFSSAMAAGLWLSSKDSAGEDDQRPPVVSPRATDGDERHEPEWDEHLEITVGPDHADLVGNDDKAIQAAVDYISRRGTGTVRLKPGTYTLRASVQLTSGLRIVGSGPETIITRGASESIALAADSDWYDQEITLADPGGFRVGDSILLQATNPHNGGQTAIKRSIIARSDRRLKLNDGLRENLWLSGKPTCSSLFPLLTSEHTKDVVIEDLVLDGNRQNTENLNGNYGGCIFLQDCTDYTIRRVEARNFNGDGISFQICHDVLVDECYSHDNADLGVHPGSGSQRPLIRKSRFERNTIGLFWCWGVRYGLAEDNQMTDNRSYGISIGHNDTDNVMQRNRISGSGLVGILFRDESRGEDFWANRNTVVDNEVINSGGEDGVAIDIQGKTKDVQIRRNTIREDRGPGNRTGIRISSTAERVILDDNRFEGLRTEVSKP
ncbi:MAG: right-handed parallel beta-helix repeat-containing protein [Planctomyces sp.]|nr:right-handed parallel beta-helix repeat-containing protein [Planctomyces sp.]